MASGSGGGLPLPGGKGSLFSHITGLRNGSNPHDPPCGPLRALRPDAPTRHPAPSWPSETDCLHLNSWMCTPTRRISICYNSIIVYVDLQKHTLSRLLCCDAHFRRKRSFDESLLGADSDIRAKVRKKETCSSHENSSRDFRAEEEQCVKCHRKVQILRVRPFATFIALVVRTTLGPPNFHGLRLAWPKQRE